MRRDEVAPDAVAHLLLLVGQVEAETGSLATWRAASPMAGMTVSWSGSGSARPKSPTGRAQPASSSDERDRAPARPHGGRSSHACAWRREDAVGLVGAVGAVALVAHAGEDQDLGAARAIGLGRCRGSFPRLSNCTSFPNCHLRPFDGRMPKSRRRFSPTEFIKRSSRLTVR